MAEITAARHKEMRERTGLGRMECKKALQECSGDIGKAEEYLRIRSGAKASKAAARVAAEGVVGRYVSADGKTGGAVGVRCEADCVGRDGTFRGLGRGPAEKGGRRRVAVVEGRRGGGARHGIGAATMGSRTSGLAP